jgi:hypothetical protein
LREGVMSRVYIGVSGNFRKSQIFNILIFNKLFYLINIFCMLLFLLLGRFSKISQEEAILGWKLFAGIVFVAIIIIWVAMKNRHKDNE